VDRQFQIRIGQDNQRIVTAEFEDQSFVTGGGGDFLADGLAACEGDEFHARVLDQNVGDFLTWPEQHTQHPRWQSGFVKQLNKTNRRERHFAGRLQNRGRAHRDGRSHFVHDLIQWMIKRRNRDD